MLAEIEFSPWSICFTPSRQVDQFPKWIGSQSVSHLFRYSSFQIPFQNSLPPFKQFSLVERPNSLLCDYFPSCFFCSYNTQLGRTFFSPSPSLPLRNSTTLICLFRTYSHLFFLFFIFNCAADKNRKKRSSNRRRTRRRISHINSHADTFQ